MDFSWSEEQIAYKNSVIKFAKNELNEGLIERDREGVVSRENWQKCADFGIIGLAVPEEYGGSDADILTTMLVMEGLGYGSKDNGLIFAINAQMWSVQHPILEFGTEEQKEEWLPKFCDEQFFPATAALMEPRITFDAVDLHTTADLDGDTLVLNGKKCMVPLADQAEHILVYATTSRDSGPEAVEAVIVDKDTPGMAIGEREKYMGLRPLPLFSVTFEECRVPMSRRVGGDNGIDFIQ